MSAQLDVMLRDPSGLGIDDIPGFSALVGDKRDFVTVTFTVPLIFISTGFLSSWFIRGPAPSLTVGNPVRVALESNPGPARSLRPSIMDRR